MKNNIVKWTDRIKGKEIFGTLFAMMLIASVFVPIVGALNNDVQVVEKTIPEIEIKENSRTSQIVQIE